MEPRLRRARAQGHREAWCGRSERLRGCGRLALAKRHGPQVSERIGEAWPWPNLPGLWGKRWQTWESKPMVRCAGAQLLGLAGGQWGLAMGGKEQPVASGQRARPPWGCRLGS